MAKLLNINYIDYSPARKSLDIFVALCEPPYCKDWCKPGLKNFANGQGWHAWRENID